MQQVCRCRVTFDHPPINDTALTGATYDIDGVQQLV